MDRAFTKKTHYTIIIAAFAALLSIFVAQHTVNADGLGKIEPVQACVIDGNLALKPELQGQYTQCLRWQMQKDDPLCGGHYVEKDIKSLPPGQIKLEADEVSLQPTGRSKLHGNVQVRANKHIVNAQTAYIYRDKKTNQIQRIELLGNVRLREPGRLFWARKAILRPYDKTGYIEDVLYRFSTSRAAAVLPAWGYAHRVERLANKDYKLYKATYSTCPLSNRVWQIEAKTIKLDHSTSRGYARDATLRVYDTPVLYTPYLNFPLTNKRKSGFLIPVYGYTNISGVDIGIPYYWNIAPNYDATIIPHVYTRRGLMLGGDFRYLTPKSEGIVDAHILPGDRAFKQFVTDNSAEFPSVRGLSDNRWSLKIQDKTAFTPNLKLDIKFHEVSDDYYLQDFSTDLAVNTQNQLLHQGDLTLTTDHWTFRGMLQSYQTMHPINQSEVSSIYRRLPQIQALGQYNDLPWHLDFNVLGEVDNFNWLDNELFKPQGPRYHANPIISMHYNKPWGYVTPSAQVVENYYDINYIGGLLNDRSFNRTIPRYSFDSGLLFSRHYHWGRKLYTQTLEPRLFYLYVPFHDQTQIPVFDSAYMIFTFDQLFRQNRFSGFDRIGDTNQVTYGATTRWLDAESGEEKASFSVGQIRYFATRRVMLCYRLDGQCEDNDLLLGFLPPNATYSPVASRIRYNISPTWSVTGDYVWDPYTRATNNSYLNFHYQPKLNHIVTFGYSYLVNGDVTEVALHGIQNNALNQATVAYSWPLTQKWSSLGVYSYNISKQYSMMSFFGLQYDTCCWAMRVVGGRTFKSLSQFNLSPQYNTNVYLQVLLKGLASAANGDPTSVIGSYLPGYVDIFRN